MENTYEDSAIRRTRRIGSFATIEINAHCPFATPRGCGDRCVLVARRAPRDSVMTPAIVMAAFREILEMGPVLRHTGIPGMEPLASPELLFALLELYHARGEHERPLRFNIITSGFKIDALSHRFRELPVHGLIISVDDTPSTGLRLADAGDTALQSAIRLRELGGCQQVCVNTLYTGRNGDAVLAIARRLHDAGVDQMLVGPMLVPGETAFTPMAGQAEMVALAQRAAADPRLRGFPMLFEVDAAALEEFGGAENGLRDDEWALRSVVKGRVSLQAINSAAPFVRVRWDGQLLARNELHAVGLTQTRAGAYRPGRIREVLEAAPAVRRELQSAA